MTANNRQWRRVLLTGGFLTLLLGGMVWVSVAACDSQASGLFSDWRCRHGCTGDDSYEGPPSEEFGGTWYWLRSPDEEKRVIAAIFNRYCIRCHGVDGRGVWDIPGIPNFTNTRWQAYRSDGQIARIIQEGRGAVMPPFRGALTLEESWAMARYLRTFVPGTEISRPDMDKDQPSKSEKDGQEPATNKQSPMPAKDVQEPATNKQSPMPAKDVQEPATKMPDSQKK